MIPSSFASIAIHLWQSTLFAGAAALLTLALRRNSARVRYAIWLAASYKFLIPFSWLVSIGHLFEWRSAPPLVPQAIATVTNVVSTPVFLMPSASVGATPTHSSLVPTAIWCVWACGFLVLTAGWAREWWRIRRMAKRGTRLDLALPIPVVSVSSQLEPGVFGIFKPVLLLPEKIGECLAPEQLRAVIAHELCHVRRRDNLAAAIHMLVEALFWFHPLVWWLNARIVDERERACDEEVVRMGSQPAAYAETVLAVCKLYAESPVACVAGVTGANIKKRLRLILTVAVRPELTRKKKIALTAAGAIAVAAPIAAGILTGPQHRAQSHRAPLVAAAVSQSANYPDSCPVTRPPLVAFVPPSPYPTNWVGEGEHAFWFGTDKLWTNLPADGTWKGLGHYEPTDSSFRQKLFWWSEGYDWRAETPPALMITGKRLDAPAPPLATDEHASGSWTDDPDHPFMVSGIFIPTLGCWEITGDYKGDRLSFVVRVTQ